MKKYVNYLDISKGFGILFVIVSHILIMQPEDAVLIYIVSFNMPMFFVISGLGTSDRFGYDYLKKKAFQILVPYFGYSFAYILIYSLMTMVFGSFDSSDVILRLLDTVTLRGFSTLWFLPYYFFALVLYKCEKKYLGKWYYVTVLGGLLYGLFGSILIFRRILIGAFFICVGDTVKLIPQKCRKHWIVVVLFAVSIILAQLNGLVGLSDCNIQNTILFVINGAINSFVWIHVAKLISKNQFLEYLGKNSMEFMVFHYLIPFISVYKKIVGVVITMQNFYMYCSLVMTLVLLSNYIVILAFKRSRSFIVDKVKAK